jgi:hypothetical protein
LFLRYARLIAIALTLGVALGAAAAPANATTFTVCAAGCSFPTITAANASASVHDGDELVVGPGTYTDNPALTKVLSVHGDPAQPRPVLASTAAAGSGIRLNAGSAGSVVSHVELDPTDLNGSGFNSTVAGTLSDAVIKAQRTFNLSAGSTMVDVSATQTSGLFDPASGGGITLRRVRMSWQPQPTGVSLVGVSGAGSLIQDSTFSAPESLPLQINSSAPTGQVTLRGVRADGGPRGILVFAGPVTITDTLATAKTGPAVDVTGGAVQLRNVTAVSAGNSASLGSFGVEARGCSGSGCTPGAITARNVIARGVDYDVDADPAGASGASGTVGIDHSNMRTQIGAVGAGVGIQSGDPLFVNGTVGASEDFHLQSGSPAIDAGVSDPLNGTTDLDGAPRVRGGGIDLGAYETTPPASPVAPATAGPTSGAGGAATPGPPLTGPIAPAALALRARRVLIDPRRGTGSLAAGCTAAAGDQCAVVGALTASLGKAKLAASRKPRKPVRIGTLTGTVQGGTQGKLTVRLTHKGLAGLRKRHTLSAAVAGNVSSAGGTTRLSTTLRLGLSKPSRKKKR